MDAGQSPGRAQPLPEAEASTYCKSLTRVLTNAPAARMAGRNKVNRQATFLHRRAVEFPC
jgi:hypothetical protein